MIEYDFLKEHTGRVYLKEKRTYEIDYDFTCLKNVNDFFDGELHINKRAEEYVYLIGLNAKNQPIGLFEVSHGSQLSSMFNIREICERLLLLGAVGYLIIHNHPSGNPTPSVHDINYTKQMKKAGEIIGLTLQDHIIFGNQIYSMRAEGNIH